MKFIELQQDLMNLLKIHCIFGNFAEFENFSTFFSKILDNIYIYIMVCGIFPIS